MRYFALILVALIAGCGEAPKPYCMASAPAGFPSYEDNKQICFKSKGWVCASRCTEAAQ